MYIELYDSTVQFFVVKGLIDRMFALRKTKKHGVYRSIGHGQPFRFVVSKHRPD